MGWLTASGHLILQQSHQQSCGYCCVGMIANLVGGRRDSESSLIALGKQLDVTAYDRAAMDRVGARRTPLVAAAYEEFGRIPHWGSGTYGDHLAELLRTGLQIDATYHRKRPLQAAIRSVTPRRPMIVLVAWKQGGGHWVVVKSRKRRGAGKASDYTILDPEGHMVVNRGSIRYRPPYGKEGPFVNHFVTVRGRLPMPRGRKLPGM